jgi:hypothetical protein
MEGSLNNVPFVRLNAGNLSERDRLLLGPLAAFIGTWSNAPYDHGQLPQGWNLISVPGPNPAQKVQGLTDGGFIFETIPYSETITFSPIAITSNFGTFPGGEPPQQVQQIGALLYDQRIKSAGAEDAFLRPDYSAEDRAALQKYFEAKGFSKGKDIHAELGMILNISNDDGGLQFARMGTIPHGNSMLCLGNGKWKVRGGPEFPGKLNVGHMVPFTENPAQKLPLAYAANTIKPNGGPRDIPFPFYPLMDPRIPYNPLAKALDGKNVLHHTHISMSTTNGTGGLLSIPFLGDRSVTRPTMDTTQMDVDYWLSMVERPEGVEMVLQYFQNIRIVFPFTGDADKQRIVWPHIGLNSLRLVSRLV